VFRDISLKLSASKPLGLLLHFSWITNFSRAHLGPSKFQPTSHFALSSAGTFPPHPLLSSFKKCEGGARGGAFQFKWGSGRQGHFMEPIAGNIAGGSGLFDNVILTHTVAFLSPLRQ
jgi:hypothetical protein